MAKIKTFQDLDAKLDSVMQQNEVLADMIDLLHVKADGVPFFQPQQAEDPKEPKLN